jgi:hypothetical protein
MALTALIHRFRRKANSFATRHTEQVTKHTNLDIATAALRLDQAQQETLKRIVEARRRQVEELRRRA